MSWMLKSGLGHPLGSRSLLAVTTLAVSSSCIGVSEKRLNPDGSLAPLRYCPTGSTVPVGGLIDDFEDGNTRVDQVEGRGGYWWKSADAMGSVIGPDDISPQPPPGEKGNAIRFLGETIAGTGDGFWGAQFGANLAQQDGYDASKYAGVRFRAKISAGSTPNVRFKISDVNTHPSFGVCTACWNHFGVDLSLSEEWTEYEFYFGTLSQAPYWGAPRPASITTKQLYAFDFQVSSGKKFDIWVDDIAFIACK
jgi:Carbohydrate binding domain (family 11)